MLHCKTVDDAPGFITGRAVNHHHLELVSWIVKLENVFELLADHRSLVIGGDNKGYSRDNLTHSSEKGPCRTPEQQSKTKSIHDDDDAYRRIVDDFQCGYEHG